jgi:pimeloyl-ACP methyl ester carboxylesterase
VAFVTVSGHRIEYVRIEVTRADRPVLIFLHEGLGSVAMWREFPGELAHATNCNAFVYSRYGYGNSDPLLAPRDVRYMHDEALVALPELLDRLAIDRPILVGHSDGASIAIIYAGGSRRDLAGLVLLAPHVLVEEISVQSIAAAKIAYQATDLRAKLARYHADVDSAFRGWNDIWLHPDFRHWNIEEYLSRIACPALAIQGKDDEYGTMDQLTRIGHQVADVELLELADCRHSPHKDQPAAVIEAVTRFIDRITAAEREKQGAQKEW